MRDPDRDEPEVPGGRAAERLRQFLASRYGDSPPDLSDPTHPSEGSVEGEVDERDTPCDEGTDGEGADEADQAAQDRAGPRPPSAPDT